MTARVSSHRRWMLRDIPRTYVLLVWLAFGAALLIYSNDWHPSGWSALRREAAVKPSAPTIDHHTGSIIIVPPRGDNCRQMMLDNRTGRMWDKGYVNCYEAVSRADKEPGGMSSLRINSIGRAFNRRTD